MRWFRFYSDALDDPKVQRLPGDLFKVWVNLLCLANRTEARGTLPSTEEIAFALRLDAASAMAQVAALVERGLLEWAGSDLAPHNWAGRQYASDDVSVRVRRHRERAHQDETCHGTPCETFHETLSATPPDTDTEQNRADVNPPLPPHRGEPAAPAAGVVRPQPGSASPGAPPPEPVPRLPRAVPKPSREPPPALAALFAVFWSAWPKRVGRQAALAAFLALRPTDEDVGRMLDAIPVQSAALQWDREGYRFCPKPATWLAERRWEDELPAERPRGTHDRPYVSSLSDSSFALLRNKRPGAYDETQEQLVARIAAAQRGAGQANGDEAR